MKFLSENIKKDISAVHIYDAENTVGTAKSITLPGKIILAHKDGSLVLSEKQRRIYLFRNVQCKRRRRGISVR